MIMVGERYAARYAAVQPCTVLRPLTDGSYRLSHATRDGRLLGRLDRSNGPLTVVPASEVARLLRLKS